MNRDSVKNRSTGLLCRDDERIKEEVEDVKSLCLWFECFISFHNVQASLLQLQMFVQKSTINGLNWVRTDVLLSPRQDDTERIWLKLWRSSAELLRDVVVGQVIICYAVRTNIFNGEVELMNADETSIEVTEISCNLVRSMCSRLKAKIHRAYDN